MSRVLVTGASGFVGSAVCRALRAAGAAVREARRRPADPGAAGRDVVLVGDLGPATDWSAALKGVSEVAHLAARVHALDADQDSALPACRAANAAGTERLARQAAAAGARRLVLASTIKVSGDATVDGPFTGDEAPRPRGAYARSKAEAEEALRRVAADTGLEIAVVRPPLVFGPGVGGNFLRLLRLVARGLPLPLGSVRNRRSLVFVDNLADLFVRCLFHPAAAGQTFAVADGTELSTADLVRALAAAMGRRARLVPFPPALLRAAASAVGRRDAIDRLLDSLVVDARKARDVLGWQPPIAPAEALARTGAWFRGRADGGADAA